MRYNCNMLTGSMSRRKAVTGFVLVAVLGLVLGAYFFSDSDYSDTHAFDGSCNVLAISIRGEILTYVTDGMLEYDDDLTSSEEVTRVIEDAQADSDIKAVLLYIDSVGGDPVAGEEMMNALKRFDKPSVAVIRGYGVSGAYWVATGADRIFASSISDVGSIAVTASYLDSVVRRERDGFKYNELTTGKYKNLGDPDKPLTQEERGVWMADLQKIHNVFVESVAHNRGLERAKVAELANGLSYVGTDALEFGLIDELGDLSTAREYLENVIGEKVELCWY